MHSTLCGLALSWKITARSQDRDVYSESHVGCFAPLNPCSSVRSLLCHEEQSGKYWHPWLHTRRSPLIWLGKDSDGISGSLKIQHVATPRADVSILLRMSWPKIHRWGLFLTRVDRFPVAAVQGGQSILHSTPTFELLSVHAVPTAIRFCECAARYAISCGRCVSRCHLPSLNPVASIICLHSWDAVWQHVPGRYEHLTVILNVVHHRLTHVLAETFLPTVLVYGYGRT